MEFEDYMSALKRVNKMSIITKISLAIGALIMFSAIFTKFPVFVYLLAIGGSFVLFFLVYELVMLLKKKFGYRHIVRAKPVKVKTVRVKKIKDDKEHVIAICPNCSKKIRLPNKKGKHGVCCPNCRNDFRVRI
ncbi:MAG: hypothetical protein MJ248_05110 [Bacilli bacterium]|nr:hypothetical protein [Bacilli bacterium]